MCIFHWLTSRAVPSFIGSESNGPDCACANAHVAIIIADIKIAILRVAIQIVAPAGKSQTS
jgi:hypothetical protein